MVILTLCFLSNFWLNWGFWLLCLWTKLKLPSGVLVMSCKIYVPHEWVHVCFITILNILMVKICMMRDWNMRPYLHLALNNLFLNYTNLRLFQYFRMIDYIYEWKRLAIVRCWCFINLSCVSSLRYIYMTTLNSFSFHYTLKWNFYSLQKCIWLYHWFMYSYSM